jgi:pyrrolidone-carboxylate peptidase
MPGAVSADVEEQRLPLAVAEMPDVAGRYANLADALSGKLSVTDSAAARRLLVTAAAQELWKSAGQDARQSEDAQIGEDDRPLYWGRLAMRRVVRERISDAEELAQLLTEIERGSRGFNDVGRQLSGGILVTGFDPFRLDQDLSQSNPSGLAALLLDGKSFVVDGTIRPIEAAVMPVRFTDFDAGMVERFLEPYLVANEVSLLVTVSMGRDQFDLERFPGRRRSASSGDNRNLVTGADATDPLVPMLRGIPLEGPEFVEFSLPAAQMQQATGAWQINDNRTITTLEGGTFDAQSLAELADQTAVRGSGGGYLSNEISYRSVLLADRLGSVVRVGHIHTPRVVGYDRTSEVEMVAQILEMLRLALEAEQ